jgi:mRNA interferase MazF
MKRGDIVTTAMQGDFGKPRPALVVQSDTFSQTESVTLLLITSTLERASLLRVDIAPSIANGLRKPSQVQIDRLMTTRRERVGLVIGTAGEQVMLEIDRQLLSFLALEL